MVDVALRCEGLSKRFGPVVALDSFNLAVAPGEVVALLGPSGCGKTTALRVIAGFEAPDIGTVEIGGRQVAGRGANLPPEKRRVGMVFQDYALFPHLNVWQNVAYGTSRSERKQRVAEVLRLVGLEGLEKRMPHELSGGQQQRVALARTLAPRPDVVLFDEPFSNLDVRLRQRVREEVREVLRATGATAVFVTHDQEEAFVLADRVVVMNQGRAEQIGTPPDLYSRPASRFVAEFVGLANFIPGSGRCGFVQTELGRVRAASEGDLDVLIRPDDLIVGEGDVQAVVTDREFLGHDLLYTLSLPSGRVLRTIQHPQVDLDPGDRVTLSLRRYDLVAFPRSGEAGRANDNGLAAGPRG
jgi:iron(III) transport system ATP-binding protein